MASPGAEKTPLIERTVQGLLAYPSPIRLAVNDGDIATNLDIDRAAAAGVIAV